MKSLAALLALPKTRRFINLPTYCENSIEFVGLVSMVGLDSTADHGKEL